MLKRLSLLFPGVALMIAALSFLNAWAAFRFQWNSKFEKELYGCKS